MLLLHFYMPALMKKFIRCSHQDSRMDQVVCRETEKGAVVSYAKQVVKKFWMWDAEPVSILMDVNQQLSSELLQESQKMKNEPYRQAIGSLLFLANASRPDIRLHLLSWNLYYVPPLFQCRISDFNWGRTFWRSRMFFRIIAGTLWASRKPTHSGWHFR